MMTRIFTGFVSMLQLGGIVVLFACVFGGYLMTGGSLAVVIEAAHQCMTTRGVHKPGVTMVTSRMLGEFRDNPATRREFMALIHNQHSGGLSNV